MSEPMIYIMAYLAGAIPFGKLVGLAHGIDIQTKGSGNIGFANVRRVLGWRAGIITLTGDILKGLLPALLALHLFNRDIAFFVGLLAIAGHIFPVWLRFHGGKGIATGLGVLITLEPIAAAVGVVVYLLGCYLTRVSSYSSLAGLITTSITGIILSSSNWWQYALLVLIGCWTLRHNLTGKVPNYDI